MGSHIEDLYIKNNYDYQMRYNTFDYLGLLLVKLLKMHDKGVGLKTGFDDAMHHVGKFQFFAPTMVYNV